MAVLGIAWLGGSRRTARRFVAGLTYNRMAGEGLRDLRDKADEAVNRYAVLPLFLVLGAVLPWSKWVASSS